MSPVLSIVIANFNYGRFLESAILSIVGQDGFDMCELLVVDGGSTDCSVDIIKKYSHRISWWVSEKDKGQSDAFNKGFARARGKYLTWLNADDFLLPGCLKRVLAEFDRHPDWEWLSGETVFVDADCRIMTTGVRMFNVVGQLLQVPSWARITAPSTFFKKEIFDRCGGMDASLHYVMDTDLWMRFHASGVRLHYIAAYVWVFRIHEQSKTSASVVIGERDQRFLDERVLIRKRHNITPFANMIAYLGKRIGCVISLGYIRRALFLFNHRGEEIGGGGNERW